MLQAESDGDALPDVDGADRDRELGNLLSAEVFGKRRELGVGEPGLRDIGHRLHPAEQGALARVVERRLLPHPEKVDPLLGQAVVAHFLDMHVDAEGAAVDLQGLELTGWMRRRSMPEFWTNRSNAMTAW
jgi:hypothetical protein